MPQKQIDFVLKKSSDLSPDQARMYQSAKDNLQHSHSPYSLFKVSCAVLTRSGTIVTGTNQENAAYPAGLCAERVALFGFKGSSKEKISSLLIIAENDQGEMADAFPCGNCRQVMLEYANLQSAEPISILMRNATGDFVELPDVRALLPFQFDSDTLE